MGGAKETQIAFTVLDNSGGCLCKKDRVRPVIRGQILKETILVLCQRVTNERARPPGPVSLLTVTGASWEHGCTPERLHYPSSFVAGCAQVAQLSPMGLCSGMCGTYGTVALDVLVPCPALAPG